ncbi:MAG: hypothetical protein ACP5QO_06955 [Clostridia bacterium]
MASLAERTLGPLADVALASSFGHGPIFAVRGPVTLAGGLLYALYDRPSPPEELSEAS